MTRSRLLCGVLAAVFLAGAVPADEPKKTVPEEKAGMPAGLEATAGDLKLKVVAARVMPAPAPKDPPFTAVMVEVKNGSAAEVTIAGWRQSQAKDKPNFVARDASPAASSPDKRYDFLHQYRITKGGDVTDDPIRVKAGGTVQMVYCFRAMKQPADLTVTIPADLLAASDPVTFAIPKAMVKPAPGR